MPDEPKNPAGESKPETPKEIEDVLKELPKPSLPALPPRPQAQLNQPRPNLPSPSPGPSSGPDKFQSFVRTMESDLEAVKKGQKPESKPFEIKPPPKGPLAPIPPIQPPGGQRTPSQPLKLGPAEKAKPLDLPKPLMPPPKPPAPMIPPTRPSGPPGRGKGFPIKINPKLLIIVLVVIVAFTGIWFFMTRQQEPEIVFTPTPTATPIPIPKTLSELIPSYNEPIIISTTDIFLTSLNNRIRPKGTVTLTGGSMTTLNLVNENGDPYSLNQVFEKSNIDLPSGFLENLNPNEWAIIAYGQQEEFDERGLPLFNNQSNIKIGLIAKMNNPGLLRSALNNWETTLTEDLKDLFGLDPKKATSEAFLDNIYSGQTIRYRNFPYADKSIDYSLVSLPRFNADYFILTNSRESIYSAIDLLQNQ